MRLIPALVFTLTLALPRPLWAEPETAKQVIRDQIAAFQVDDFATAFSFASAKVQGLFRTPQNFGQMVQRGYPMVWRPTALTFLSAKAHPGGVVQSIEVQDRKGRRYVLDYLVLETDAGWRIDGVFLRPPSDVGA
ncbi:DUF4864 domain-containing protein [Thalassobius sp. Cn5-15]|uniref:DUF4864 domain-containing protein n=1 Tax=Thalassobius sp. Cn5-15 TaxID=2917763 RepID=UPI001EF1DF04|nr:DUF4864 domain-containing protein [Thalassobius sp. Cn5-15]MCG7493365.1 DUF4864 domain-containing protein [Thalassobius sp. Cn5-15]